MVLICLGLSGNSTVCAGEADESALKAAFLYNFAKFTEWPQEFEVSSEFVIGILRPEGMTNHVSLLTAETVRGRPIRVRFCETPQEALDCHLLYLNTTESALIGDFVAALRGKPILLVSEAKGAAGMGVMIGFFTVGEKLRFEINLDSATRAGLSMSAHLLGMARIITPVNTTNPTHRVELK